MSSAIPSRFLFAVFLSLLFALTVVTSLEANGRTITVDQNGEGDFIRIQDAIDDAVSGDGIYIRSGMYPENLTIVSGIDLLGNNNTTTIVRGSILVNGTSECRIRHLTIANGLLVNNSKRISIIGNIIRGGSGIDSEAVRLLNSTGCRIQDNRLDSLSIHSSSDNRVTGNRGVGNGSLEIKVKDGLDRSGARSNVIMDNVCSYIGITWSDRNFVINNTCSDSNWVGIYLNHASRNEISLNRCRNNAVYGIYMDSESTHNTLSGNICTGNNGTGIYLYHSVFNDIIDNQCSENALDGIHLDVAPSNTLAFNTCAYNGRYGINIIYYRFNDEEVQGNILISNSVYENQEGVHIRVEKSFWSDYFSFECLMCYTIVITSLIPVFLMLRLKNRNGRID